MGIKEVSLRPAFALATSSMWSGGLARFGESVRTKGLGSTKPHCIGTSKDSSTTIAYRARTSCWKRTHRNRARRKGRNWQVGKAKPSRMIATTAHVCGCLQGEGRQSTSSGFQFLPAAISHSATHLGTAAAMLACRVYNTHRQIGGKEWESNPPGTSDAPHRI